MRPDGIRLGILAVVTLFVCPCATLAQGTTSTDAAIAELRQLIVDQRAALDRQARLIEEQGRTLAALQQRVDGNSQGTERGEPAAPATTTAAAAVGAQAPAPQGPPGRTAAEPAPDLPAAVVTAGEFPGSIRIPGTDSAFKLGGQARMVAVHTLQALGTDDKFVASSIPVGVPRAGEEARTVYSPTASRLSTELRMPSARGPMRMFIESDFAGAGRAMRLRHAFLQTERFVVGQTWSTFSDPRGRSHRHRLRRPERHLPFPPAPVSLDAEGWRTLPVGPCARESGTRPDGCRRASTTRPTSSGDCDGNRAASAGCSPTRVTCRRRCWSGSCAAKCQDSPRSRS